MTKFIQVSTIVESKVATDKIARKILAERVASCVQVLGPDNQQLSLEWKD